MIDRNKREVITRWSPENIAANFPLALDEQNHRLFVGCRKPVPWMFVLATGYGSLMKVHSISGDPDDLFYDAQRKRIYASCGEGFIDVIEQGDGDNYETLEKISTRAGARTSYFSPDLNEFYLAVPRRGKEGAEIRVYQPK